MFPRPSLAQYMAAFVTKALFCVVFSSSFYSSVYFGAAVVVALGSGRGVTSHLLAVSLFVVVHVSFVRSWVIYACLSVSPLALLRERCKNSRAYISVSILRQFWLCSSYVLSAPVRLCLAGVQNPGPLRIAFRYTRYLEYILILFRPCTWFATVLRPRKYRVSHPEVGTGVNVKTAAAAEQRQQQ